MERCKPAFVPLSRSLSLSLSLSLQFLCHGSLSDSVQREMARLVGSTPEQILDDLLDAERAARL